MYFAKDEERYDELGKINKSQFNQNNKGKKLLFNIASQEKLMEQIFEADVIYLHGGKTLKLLNVLKQFPQLKESFTRKVVAGESAGAYVLSRCFYSKSENGFFGGLDVVPAKTTCHHEDINEEKLDDCPGEKLLLKDY